MKIVILGLLLLVVKLNVGFACSYPSAGSGASCRAGLLEFCNCLAPGSSADIYDDYYVWGAPGTFLMCTYYNIDHDRVEGYVAGCARYDDYADQQTNYSTSKNQCTESGSIIRLDSQVLGEEVPIVGSKFKLYYTSERTKDFSQSFNAKYNVQIFKNSYDVYGVIAGRNTPIQNINFTENGGDFIYFWDGLNSLQERMFRPQKMSVHVLIGSMDYVTGTIPVGTYNSKLFGLAGWSISVHHYYDSLQRRIYLGDGTTIGATAKVLSNGNVQIVGSSGNEVFVFDSEGKHLQTLSGLTGSVKYTFNYNSSQHLTSIVDAYGNTTNITRDINGAINGIVSPYGQVTNITLATNGFINTITQSSSQVYTISYKVGTELIENFIRPGGQTSSMTYNSDGTLLKDQGSGGDFWSIVSTINAGIKTITKSSSMGRTQTLTINGNPGTLYSREEKSSFGFVNMYSESENQQINNSAIQHESKSFSSDERFGNLYKRLSTYQDDYLGLVNYGQTVNYPNGASPDFFNFSSINSTITYDSTKIINQTYDATTRESVLTTPEGVVSKNTININEQPISQQQGNDISWTMSYDTNGRLSQVAQGTHNTINYTYNAAGLLGSVTNVLGQMTTYVYDSIGRLLTLTLPDQRVISYSYDLNGNVTSVTPPGRPVHGFNLNNFGLLDTYSPPALVGLTNKNTIYAYNNDKQLTQVQRPDGVLINYNYHATTGLLTSIGLTSGSFDYTYMYNSNLLDQANSPDGFFNKFTYIGNDILTESSYKYAGHFLYGKITYSYDTFKRIKTRKISGNDLATVFTRTYGYNNDNKPTKISEEYLTYEYPSGRLSTTVLNKISDLRTYDAYGNLATYSAVYNPATGAPTTLYSYTLTRDLMSRITSVSETLLGTTNTYEYTYDVAGRLTQVLKNSAPYSSYVYDSNGNRISGVTAGVAFTATYDDQDRMLTYNSRIYSYNANGDVAQIQWSPTQTSSYVYDAFGTLKSAITSSGNSLVYSYDGLNQRVRKMDGTTFKYQNIYEQSGRIAAHTNNAGVIQKEYLYGLDHPNVPDYMDTGSVNYRIIKNHLGSPRIVVNASNGTVSQRMDYDDLGNVTNDTNPGFQVFGFAGGLYDSQTKLVKFGAREYDARAAGRWMSKDPIRFSGGDTNLYGYVANDPVNWTDPTGLDRRRCSRRLNSMFTPIKAGKLRHDYVQFRDSKGNLTTKSWGNKGMIDESGIDTSTRSCGDWEKSSDKADQMAEDLADNLNGLMDYGGATGYNCQDYSDNVFNFQRGR